MILLTYGENEGFNLAANVVGLPSMTIPYGIQFIGSYLGEEELIKIGYALESQGGVK